MCNQDFLKMPSVMARMTAALGEMKAAGINKEIAEALVALSEGETAAVWRTQRPDNKVETAIQCCGQMVGIEMATFNAVLQTQPNARSWLQDHGWLGYDQGSQQLVPAGGFNNPFDPRPAMLYLEFCIATELDAGLRICSVGPTQMFLGVAATLDALPCGFPKTRDELWAFYSGTRPRGRAGNQTVAEPVGDTPA